MRPQWGQTTFAGIAGIPVHRETPQRLGTAEGCYLGILNDRIGLPFARESKEKQK